ncbi:hypothetical protein K493DRAFT_306412 [Basidiobolus meristosporus CBS 931.73]|uniref:Uncharacterized protein n=1 Tax=Basidiobolus meristosporus CBS 931.73 TaxID=1314790 RepID=A0A1Y1XSH1_9FUNG|nr:hypothetical protein K493DRAFT_306412 [Basidiobolus meristosporus CBS 931.73]|eukprot:ORX88678.1 hypothetical protein K493DRAFT_306412 [Basidiobolus meristosporus CBS 931.73]
MLRSLHILSTVAFLVGVSLATPIDTYNQQVGQTPYFGQGGLVDASGNTESESYTPTYYQLNTYPLLENVQTNSVQDAQALSKLNQYDQVQQVDQTLYQPYAPTYVQPLLPLRTRMRMGMTPITNHRVDVVNEDVDTEAGTNVSKVNQHLITILILV